VFFRIRTPLLHAYRKREALELNVLERFEHAQQHSGKCVELRCSSLLNLYCVVCRPKYADLSGMAYILTGVAMGANGTIMGRRRRRMERDYAD